MVFMRKSIKQQLVVALVMAMVRAAEARSIHNTTCALTKECNNTVLIKGNANNDCILADVWGKNEHSHQSRLEEISSELFNDNRQTNTWIQLKSICHTCYLMYAKIIDLILVVENEYTKLMGAFTFILFLINKCANAKKWLGKQVQRITRNEMNERDENNNLEIQLEDRTSLQQVITPGTLDGASFGGEALVNIEGSED